MLQIEIDETLDTSLSERFAHDSWRPIFQVLRERAPVHYCTTARTGPFWSVTRFNDIKAVDANHQDFSSEIGGPLIGDISPEDPVPIETFIAMDPPRHDAQRAVVAPALQPRALAELEGLIRTRVVDILDHLPTNETFDWVERVSKELTSRMLATLVDFPYEERHKLILWSDVAASIPDLQEDAAITTEERISILGEAAARFMGLWTQRSENPGNDLISMLATGEATQTMATNPAEFLGNVILLLVGGNDTTRNSISGGVLAFHEYPEEYEKLESAPRLIPNMVSETIRWQTPIMHMRRTATRDCELAGQFIWRGDKVVMWYLSGNRDESVFEAGDKFTIDRPNARQHLSFGFGIHRCLGNRLAEMQLRVLWEEILPRFRRIEVAGPVQRVQSNAIRGISQLPVRVKYR